MSKIESDEEAIEFIDNQYKKAWGFGEVKLEEARSNKYLSKLMDNIEFIDGTFYFKFNNDVHVGAIKGLKEHTWNNNIEALNSYYNEIYKNDKIKISFKEHSKWNEGEYNISISDEARKLLRTYYKLYELGENPKIHKELDNVKKQIVGYFNERIIGEHIKDFSNKDLKVLRDTLRDLEMYGKYVLRVIGTDCIKPGLIYLYQKFAHRYNATTKEDRYKIREYSEILPHVLKLLTLKV